nr:hypothetical protein BaRGS_019282 [Batillaria attramentaria]
MKELGWINIKKIFCNFYDSPRYNLETMLHRLGMEFEGRPHCGLDDSKNIARIAINLLQDGCTMKFNESYDGCPAPPKCSMPGRHLDTGDGMHSGDHVAPVVEKGTSRMPKLSVDGSVKKESHISHSKENTLKDLSETDSGEDVGDLLAYFKLQST